MPGSGALFSERGPFKNSLFNRFNIFAYAAATIGVVARADFAANFRLSFTLCLPVIVLAARFFASKTHRFRGHGFFGPKVVACTNNE